MTRKKPAASPPPIRIPLGHGLVALVTFKDDRIQPTDDDTKENCA